MNTIKKASLASALLVSVLLSPIAPAADAHEIKIGSLVIHHPWIRQAPGKAEVAAAYTTIDNTGKDDDTLVKVDVDGVPIVQIHTMNQEGDVMKMNEMKDGVAIPAGKTVEMKPKSLHIMLSGLKSAYMVGEDVKGSFTFAKAGKVAVDFEVVAPGTDAPMKH